MIKMTDEMKKQIQQLKTENEDMIATMLAMRREIDTLATDNEYIQKELTNSMTVVRAVAELQEELRKYHPDVIFIHTVRAPMGA